MITVTKQQQNALAITTAGALVFGAFFLHYYFSLIVFAAIVAFISNPLYQRLLKKWGKPHKAASITLLCAFLAIIIPLILVLIFTVYQIWGLVDHVKTASYTVNSQQLMQNTVNFINHVLSSLHISYQVTEQAIRNGLSDAIKNFGTSLVQGLTSSISGFVSFFTIAIIYMYVFVSLLVNQQKILDTLHRLSPLGSKVSELYTQRMAAMTKAMVRGQFIIAFTQGFTDAFFLYLAGFRSTFFFFGILLSLLSVIPLGGGIIVIPIGIILILTGNIWQGALVLAGHFLVVTNEDNIMRPKLVPKQARLDAALTMLSVFSGLKFFGFLGIVIGPVIMILIVTTIQVFMEVFRNIESVDESSHTKSASKVLKKLAFWKKDKPVAQ